MTVTDAPAATLDEATLTRLRGALDEVLGTHQAELEDSEGPEADVHRTVCSSVEDALARLTDGTYGRCTRCEAALPLERLEIIPQAELCMPCHDGRNRLYG